MEDYESVLVVKPEVFVYKIPPRTTNRGYRAADWDLQNPDWTGRMRLVSKGNDCTMKLEDKNSGELFAKCPIDKYPGIAVEAVMDSSRYFVVRIQDDNGRAAFIGMGFADRSDSFDLNVALQDHFKWVQKNEKIEQDAKEENKVQLDLGFKEGETITINMKIGQKTTGSGTPRTRPKSSGTGLLPPPPGGVKIMPPVLGMKVDVSGDSRSDQVLQHNLKVASDGHRSLLDLDSPPAPAGTGVVPPLVTSNETWGDFTSAGSETHHPISNIGQNSSGWVQF